MIQVVKQCCGVVVVDLFDGLEELTSLNDDLYFDDVLCGKKMLAFYLAFVHIHDVVTLGKSCP